MGAAVCAAEIITPIYDTARAWLSESTGRVSWRGMVIAAAQTAERICEQDAPPPQ